MFYNHIKSQIQKNKRSRIIKKKLLLAVLSSVSQVGETFRPGAPCAKGTYTYKPVIRPFSPFMFRCTKCPDQILFSSHTLKAWRFLLYTDGRKMNIFLDINKPVRQKSLDQVAGSLKSSSVRSDTITVAHCGPALATLTG